jgi:glycosyltransferase involved in cell wall biosynthesis
VTSIRTPRAECRLLFLVGQLGPGGLERQLFYLLQSLNRARYKPAVMAWSRSPIDAYTAQIQALDIPVYSLADLPSARAKLRACRHLIRQLKPEVVHSYTFYTNFAAYWSTRGMPAVSLGSVRCDFSMAKNDCGPWLGSASARWPSHQIFNSAAAADECRSSWSLFAPRRVSVVRNGLDLQRFRHSSDSVDSKDRIVGIGSLLAVKRWDRVCRLTAEVKQLGIRCVVQIVGDGPLRNRLERQARDLGVSDLLEFAGYREDVSTVLANSRFLVHTSDSEGCPNAVMEAMACGRPVVATAVGDVPSLVEEGTTGFVVGREDEEALLDRVLTLLNDDALCRRMGAAAREKAEREFGLDRLVHQTLAAYEAAGWKDA